MAKGNRSLKRISTRLIYFYLGDKPHKVIHIMRPADLVVAWSYDDRKRVSYIWSDLQKRMEPALKAFQVSKLVSRDRTSLQLYVKNGAIPPPKMIYTLDGHFTPLMRLWSVTDIMNLHDYLLTQHLGAPRKDGLITPKPMPTKAEIRAMLKHEPVFYVQKSDGEFAPVWKEHTW